MCTEARIGDGALRAVLEDLLAIARTRAVTTDDLIAGLRRDGIDEAWIGGWL